MKLRRLRLAQFKRFRDPLEIAALDDGINLFAAPNEAGKSTLGDALRAAFFERSKSGVLDFLQPWGDPLASPSVEVDFELDGCTWKLAKSFVKSKKCTLAIGDEVLDGEAAEDRVAARFGFGYAGKGESRPDVQGLPGLLWVRQGTTQELDQAVEWAQGGLRDALSTLVGEVASSDADAVLQTIETKRALWLTSGTAQPRGDYREARDRLAAAEEEARQLAQQAHEHRKLVDGYAARLDEHRTLLADRPWERFEAERDEASRMLADAESLTRRRADADHARAQAARERQAHEDRLRLFAQDEVEAGRRRETAAAAAQRREAAEARREQAEAAQRESDAALDAAAKQLALAQHADQRTRLEADIARDTRRAAESDELRRRAREAAEADSRYRTEAARLSVPPASLKALREADTAWRDAMVRIETLATTLVFQLDDGVVATLGGEPVSDAATRTVTAPTVLALPGIGRIDVRPGGDDLPALREHCASLAAQRARLLAELAVDSLAAAEARDTAARDAEREARTALRMLEGLAPKGVEALDGEHQRLLDAVRAATLARDALPPIPEGTAIVPRLEAEAGHVRATRDRESARDALRDASEELAAAREAAERADIERQQVEDRLVDPARQAQREEALVRIAELRKAEDEATQQIGALDAALSSSPVERLRQDVDRLRRSALAAREEEAALRNEVGQRATRIDTLGAAGIDERLAEAEARRDRERERVAQFDRQLAALGLLVDLLRERRDAFAQRLRAPLQQRMTHYLSLMFPGARLEIGEGLAPTTLKRDDAAGGAFEGLSFGTREQLAVLARLAYADLLRDAGRPTLIILDDALVHSDPARLKSMKQALWDAATRHQILLFTCHPEAWRDLGVRARALATEAR